MLARMAVLEGRGLTRVYKDRKALNEVSLIVDPGESVAIAGPNGAGKTTLLSILAGVQQPDGGSVDTHGAQLGWVPQKAAVYGKLTVRENLRLFAKLEGVRGGVESAVDRVLARVGLEDRAGSRAESLSGGMRQRLSIGMGLISEPAVLLLDEPSAALDPLQRERLWELLGSLAEQGIAVVFSTHSAGEVEGHATRVLVLDGGNLIYDGPPSGIGPGAHFELAFINFLREHRGEGVAPGGVS